MIEILILILALCLVLINLILYKKYDKIREEHEVLKALVFNEIYKSKKPSSDFEEFLKNAGLENEYFKTYVVNRDKYGVYFLWLVVWILFTLINLLTAAVMLASVIIAFKAGEKYGESMILNSFAQEFMENAILYLDEEDEDAFK